METRSVSPVFVGRTAELATLHDALARADAAEPQALLLGGEAGVGKTRLVEEFAAAAAAAARSSPSAAAWRSAPTGCRSPLLRRAAGPARRPARGVRRRRGRPRGGTGPAAARPRRGRRRRHDEQGMARLFELTARLLERVATAHTVVLVLEDLHWADASTRHLLAYLLRTLRAGRLLVLASYRSDDIHRRHPLRPCSPNWTGCAPSAGSNSPASPARRPAARSPASSPPNPTPPRSTRSTPAPTATPSSSRNSPSPPARATAPASPTPCATCSWSGWRRCPRAPSGSPGSSPRAAPRWSTG
ncbi:AAA family ATPase [Streptomyces nogalater]